MTSVSRTLPSELVPQKGLSADDVRRLHVLMETCYDHVSYELFIKDLAHKDWVLLLRDSFGIIQGFSTLVLNPCGVKGADYDILYSGDTVIHPDHWGGQALVRGFFNTAGEILAKRRKRLYWYLLSKGHRTYMYLPLFFKRYFPAAEPSRHWGEGGKLVALCSEQLFPDSWLPSSGVIHFDEHHGQVNATLAENTRRRSHHPQVDFFLRKNPGFDEGDELACLAELEPENLHHRVRGMMKEGMEKSSIWKEALCLA